MELVNDKADVISLKDLGLQDMLVDGLSNSHFQANKGDTEFIETEILSR
jgi:hypothetical protein